MDAFAHSLEAYCSPHYHPMSQGIALEGMRLVKDYLPRAFADGNDLEARAQMMSAAAMGGHSLSKRLGCDPRAVTPRWGQCIIPITAPPTRWSCCLC